MRYGYDGETDILTIRLAARKPDFAEQADNIITHYGKDGRPVEIEILDARRTMLALIKPILASNADKPAEHGFPPPSLTRRLTLVLPWAMETPGRRKRPPILDV